MVPEIMAVSKGVKSVFSSIFKPVNRSGPKAAFVLRSFSNSADKKVIVVTGASRQELKLSEINVKDLESQYMELCFTVFWDPCVFP